MTSDVIIAQADSLSEWAEQWSRESRSGASEVAFQLARVAKLMRKIASDDAASTGWGSGSPDNLEQPLPPAEHAGIRPEE